MYNCHGRQGLWCPQWPQPPGVHSVVYFPPHECGMLSDLLLINIKWQRRQDVTSMRNLHKIVTFLLLSDSTAFLAYMLWCNKMPSITSGWCPTNNQLGREALISTILKEVNSSKNHLSLQSTSFPGRAFTWNCNPC